MQIGVVVGTRPEIVKMAPVLRALAEDETLDVSVIHTGQHYDSNLSDSFFRELQLPNPDVNLRVGSRPPAHQVGSVMIGLEDYFEKAPPDVVLAVGDTNSVLATALACCKLKIPFGHVEAGLRCFDSQMSEEMNRVIADRCAEICFAPTQRAVVNLTFEGIERSKIHITGNTVVDACIQHVEMARQTSKIGLRLGFDLSREKYLLFTVHRQENTENPFKLKALANILLQLGNERIIFPVHPRTQTALETAGLWPVIQSMRHVTLLPPLSYLDFLLLESQAAMVLTDSGGVQEESLSLQVPCITLRGRTERPEGIDLGLNIVTDMNPDAVIKAVAHFSAHKTQDERKLGQNPFGDGKAGVRIANLCSRHSGGTSETRTKLWTKGSPEYLLADFDSLDSHNNGILCYFDSEGSVALSPPTIGKSQGWKALIVN